MQGNISQKKGEIMTVAATWMNLETIKLSEVSETERQVYNMSYVQDKI